MVAAATLTAEDTSGVIAPKNNDQQSTPTSADHSFKLHVFFDEIIDKKIVFQIVRMLDQLFIIVNTKDNMHFSDLSVAMPTKYDSIPIGTTILGNLSNDFSKNLAVKLARRLKKCVYLSCNIDYDRFFIQAVERALNSEIQRNPDKF